MKPHSSLSKFSSCSAPNPASDFAPEFGRDSAPDSGLDFASRSPSGSASGPSESASNPASNPASKSAANSPLRMLFVDDEPDLRELVIDAGQDLGVLVTPAASGFEALRLFEQGAEFDLVFSDFRMPQMNGFGLITEVRSLRPDLPFLFWSGHWDPSDVASLVAMGRVRCLEKPFRSGEFKSLISEFKTNKFG